MLEKTQGLSIAKIFKKLYKNLETDSEIKTIGFFDPFDYRDPLKQNIQPDIGKYRFHDCLHINVWHCIIKIIEHQHEVYINKFNVNPTTPDEAKDLELFLSLSLTNRFKHLLLVDFHNVWSNLPKQYQEAPNLTKSTRSLPIIEFLVGPKKFVITYNEKHKILSDMNLEPFSKEFSQFIDNYINEIPSLQRLALILLTCDNDPIKKHVF